MLKFKMTRNGPIESKELNDASTVVDIHETDKDEEELDCIDEVDAPINQDVKTGNILSSKRSFIMDRMDVALMMANASQLKAVLSSRDQTTHFHMLLTFIVTSMCLQLVFTLCMLIKWSFERRLQEEKESDGVSDTSKQEQDAGGKVDNGLESTINQLDLTGNVLVLVIVVVNILITGFGIETDKYADLRGLPHD